MKHEDEIEIDRLITNGAPNDCFGVGTSMGVSSDAPGLGIAYKLTETMAFEGMVESGTINILGMFRQVGPYRGRQIGI